MFTGIVQAYREVLRVTEETDLRRLQIDMTSLTDDLQLGASVAINGTCLTVTRIVDEVVWFDVIRQTLDTTNIGDLKQGDFVNLERSFRVGDDVLKPRGRKRWPSDLYMDGPSLINFTVGMITDLVEGVLERASMSALRT